MGTRSKRRRGSVSRGVLAALCLGLVLLWQAPHPLAASGAKGESGIEARETLLGKMSRYREVGVPELGAEGREAILKGGEFSREPVSFASADMDGDGVLDLICGHKAGTQGVVEILFGDVASLFPRTAGGDAAPPFLDRRLRVQVETVPEVMAAGDFNGDGVPDLALGCKGAPFFLIYGGDRKGALTSAHKVALAGGLAELRAGEFNRMDGRLELAALLDTPGGAAVNLYFPGSAEAFARPLVVALPAPCKGLVFGQILGDKSLDMAVLGKKDLFLIAGHGDPNPFARAHEVTRHSLPFSGLALALGDFLGDSGAELAVSGDDGKVHFFDAGGGGLCPQTVDLPGGLSGGASQVFASGRFSTSLKDNLLFVAPSEAVVQVLILDQAHADEGAVPVRRSILKKTGKPMEGSQSAAAASEGWGTASTVPEGPLSFCWAPFPAKVRPGAVHFMRLNGDALEDVILAQPGSSSPVGLWMSDALTTFTVNNTGDESDGDTGDGICDTGNAEDGFTGICTFRAATQQANATPGMDTIVFAIGSGHKTITATWDYSISEAVTINGTTQPGFAGTPIIEIDLNTLNSIFLTAGNSVIRGLVVNRAGWHCLQMTNGGNNTIQGNYFGTDVTGTLARSDSGQSGIGVFCNGNTIGGSTAQAKNLASGNINEAGIAVAGDNNTIVGNICGTNVTGTQALGNIIGILVSQDVDSGQSGDNNLIGDAGAGNLLSGNTMDGIQVSYGASGNLIQNNIIGLDAAQTKAIGNISTGVHIDGGDASKNTSDNTVGKPALPNVVSGNDGIGVAIVDAATQNTLIHGNLIGTTAGGAAFGNGDYGILVGSAGPVFIGGDTADVNPILYNLGGIFMNSLDNPENPIPLSIKNVLVQENDAMGLIAAGVSLSLENVAIIGNKGGITCIGDFSATHIEVTDNPTGILCMGKTLYLDDGTITENGTGVLFAGSLEATVENTLIEDNRLFGLIATAIPTGATGDALAFNPVTVRDTEVTGNGQLGILGIGDITLNSIGAAWHKMAGVVTLSNSLGVMGADVITNGVGMAAISKGNVSIIGADLIGNTLGLVALGGTRVDVAATDISGNFKGGMIGVSAGVSVRNSAMIENAGLGVATLGKSVSLVNTVSKKNKLGGLVLFAGDLTMGTEEEGEWIFSENEGTGLLSLGKGEVLGSSLQASLNGKNGIFSFGNFSARGCSLVENGANGFSGTQSTATLEDATISGNQQDGVHLSGGQSVIEGNDISGNTGNGVSLKRGEASLSYNGIHANGADGVLLKRACETLLTQNNLFDNGGFGVNAPRRCKEAPVSAESNWWGDAEGPKGPAGDGVHGDVDYTPWLTAPNAL